MICVDNNNSDFLFYLLILLFSYTSFFIFYLVYKYFSFFLPIVVVECCRDYSGMNYIEDKDPKNLQIFVGATTAMIPFNSILQHDQTMEEKNWGVKGRLRMKRYDSVLDFLLMLGGTIS